MVWHSAEITSGLCGVHIRPGKWASEALWGHSCVEKKKKSDSMLLKPADPFDLRLM